MKKLVVILVVLGAAALLAWPIYIQMRAAKTDKGRPGRGAGGGAAVPVEAALVTTRPVPREIVTFGVVDTLSAVSVRAQVSGTLMEAPFEKGEMVKKGQRLFTIDPRPFDAALAQAEATLARDKAQLNYAVRNAADQKALLDKGIASRNDYDKSQADADALAAATRADDAAIKNAKLQLEYCTIESPVDGKAGDILVTPGNLVKANDSILVTINQISPIEVNFSVPQEVLPDVRKFLAAGKLEVRAIIPNEEDDPQTGYLTFIDNTVDRSTGTIQLGATFANKAQHPAGLPPLWPGLYVHVGLVLAIDQNAIVVPSKAVQTGRDGKFVFVIKPDKTAEMRPVTVDRLVGELSVISKGLKPNEQIVTDGHVRVAPGSRVQVGPAPGTSAPARTAATTEPATSRRNGA